METKAASEAAPSTPAVSAPRRPTDRLGGWEASVFWALVCVHVVPIWAFKHFPSQDGPAHLDSANVLRLYNRQGHEQFRKYYTINSALVPNWAAHAALAGLMTVTSPRTAERLLLTVYVIGLLAAVRYAVRAVSPRAAFVSMLAMPFVYGYALHMGFYSFCLGTAMFFFILGYWIRRSSGMGPGHVLVMAILAVLALFCHPIPLTMAAVAVGGGCAWLAAMNLRRDVRAGRFGAVAIWQAIRSRIIGPVVALAPAAVLLAMFVARSEGTADVAGEGAAWRLSALLHLAALASYRAEELWLSGAVAFGLAAVTLLVLWDKCRHRRFDRSDGLLLLAVAYTAVFFVVPARMSGGAFIVIRLSLFPFFAIILWLAAQEWRAVPRIIVQAAAGAVALAMLAMHAQDYSRLNGYLDEYLSAAAHIKAGSTLLPVSFSNTGEGLGMDGASWGVGPYRHAAGHIAADLDLVNLGNYEAAESHFPIRYRPELDPYAFIGPMEEMGWSSPRRLDIIGYPRRTGGRIDYVLVWGLLDGPRQHPNAPDLLRQLDEAYDPIYTSPRGLVRLYDRRQSAE
ncbi:MAG: hypothetical protein ACE15C_04395 [Phycisphaerae bacterium]